MNPITVRYAVRPRRRSLAAAHVVDLFGLAADEPPLTVADSFHLDARPGDVILFTGPSGCGKSSLLREAGRRLAATDVNALSLPDDSLIDALPGSIEDRLALLSACGLAEARLALRCPDELSDGQRFRFRLAVALAGNPAWLLADEFAAVLDRPTAKVLAFTLRRVCKRRGVGLLAATTHDDVAADLNPDLHVRLSLDGRITAERRDAIPQPLSFSGEFSLCDGTAADWPPFARWHYRGHRLACVKRVVLLKHGPDPVGVCVFTTPAASLTLRSRYFGLTGPRSSDKLASLNQQMWLLARVVLHPTYRGAGVGAWFVRSACESCPVPWVETLSAMGQVNPFFEKAGFVRVGVIRKAGRRGDARGAYGGKSKSPCDDRGRFGEPVYYVFDNRRVTSPSP